MAVILSDKLNNGLYGFFAKVFNWPSSRTISEYNSIGGNAPDGVLYDVLDKINGERSVKDSDDDWRSMVSLKFDACHVADKVIYNAHTNSIVGFAHDAFDIDVLLEELGSESNTDEDDQNDTKTEKHGEHAKQYIIFMITTWEKNMKATKHVVARYACGDGISSNFILNCVSKITVALYRYGLIVNNVVGDGATENRTACRRLATLTVEEVIGDFLPPYKKIFYGWISKLHIAIQFKMT